MVPPLAISTTLPMPGWKVLKNMFHYKVQNRMVKKISLFFICNRTGGVQTHLVAKPWGSRAAVLQLLNETVRTQSCPIRKRHPAKNPSETLRKLRGKSQIKNKLLNNM